jgi:hypothetical protein
MTVSKIKSLELIQNSKGVFSRDIDTAELEAFLGANKLNWDVSKRKLQDQFGNPTNIFGVFRNDTNFCFGGCREKYTPLQNNVFGEFCLSIADALKLDPSTFDIQQFDGGAVRMLTIESREHTIGKKVGDKVGEYLMIVDSYNGSKAFGIGFGHRILSCSNGMSRLDNQGYISLRHSGDLNQKIKDASSGLRRIQQESELMLLNYEKMMELPANKTILDLAWKNTLDLKPLEYRHIDELPKQTREAAERFELALNTEVANKGNNAWGVFFGVTRYTTEETMRKPERLKAKFVGRLAKSDLKTYNDILNYMN